MSWRNLRNIELLRIRREGGDAAKKLLFRRRIDPASVGILLLFALVGSVLLAATVVFDKERLEWSQVPDERILINYTDDLDGDPFVDAVFRGENALAFARRSGSIHQYDPTTELWNKFNIEPITRGTLSPLSQLQSGCGDIDAKSNESCPAKDYLWAVTEQGGLALQRGGDWKVVVSDTMFQKSDGKPVEQDEITHLRVSADGNWLLAIADNKEVGVYGSENAHWRSISESNVGNIINIEWWDGFFWLGGEEGLAKLDPVRKRISTEKVEGASYRIQVLEAHADTGLWVLAMDRCSTKGESKIKLSVIQTQGRQKTVIDEQHCFPELDLDQVRFVQVQGDHFIAQTDTGIYAYTQDLHQWNKPVDGSIITTVDDPNENVLWFSKKGEVGVVKNGEVARKWRFENSDVEIKRLVPIAQDTALGLSKEGSIYRFSNTKNIETIFQAPKVVKNWGTDQFLHIIGDGNRVLFISKDRVLSHDMERREYHWFNRKRVPEWLVGDRTHYIKSGEVHYAIVTGGVEILVYPFNVSDFPASVSKLKPIRLKIKDFLHAVPWANNSVALINRKGQMWHVGGYGIVAESGTGRVDPPNGDINDALLNDNTLFLGMSSGLYEYDMKKRSWRASTKPRVRDGIQAIAHYKETLLGVTEKGNVVDGRSGKILIGGRKKHHIFSDQLSDVLEKESKLYLAGPGGVDVYDAKQRKLAKHFRLPRVAKGAAVQIIDIVADKPLTLAQETLFLGERVISQGGGQVKTASVGGGRIWTVRREGRYPYLRGHLAKDPFDGAKDICMYRYPTSRYGATAIFDAVEIGSRSILVLTDTGVEWYDPVTHNWYGGIRTAHSRGDRMYLLEGQLLVAKQSTSGYRLSLLDFRSPSTRNGCDDRIQSLTSSWSATQVRDYVVDLEQGSFTWLDKYGQMKSGNERILGSKEKPATTSFLRFYQKEDDWLFSTPEGIWRYRLAKQEWHFTGFQGLPTGIDVRDVWMEGKGETTLINLISGEGTTYSGQYRLSDKLVTMKSITRSQVRRANLNPRKLLDVQSDENHRWLLLFENEVVGYDAANRKWLGRISFPDSDASRRLMRIANRWVVTDRAGSRWWIQRSRGNFLGNHNRKLEHAFWLSEIRREEEQALTQQGNLIRLRSDGAILECSETGNAGCEMRQAPAMKISPLDVQLMYEWNRYLIFITTTGMKLFNLDRQQEVRLPAISQLLRDLKDVRIFADQIWMLSKQGTLYNMNRTMKIKEMANGVGDLKIVDKKNELWMVRNGKARRWNGLNWISLHQGNRMQPRIWVDETTGATSLVGKRLKGINGSVNVSQWSGALKRSGSAYADTKGVGYWLILKDELLQVVEENCRMKHSYSLFLEPKKPARSRARCATVKDRFPTKGLKRLSITSSPIRVSEQKLDISTRSNTYTIEVSPSSLESRIVATRTKRTPPGILKNVWPEYQSHVIKGRDGKFALNPITDISGADRIVAERPTGQLQIAAGSVELKQPAPLETEWISWSRKDKAFSLPGRQQQQALSPTEMIINGLFSIRPPRHHRRPHGWPGYLRQSIWIMELYRSIRPCSH